MSPVWRRSAAALLAVGIAAGCGHPGPARETRHLSLPLTLGGSRASVVRGIALHLKPAAPLADALLVFGVMDGNEQARDVWVSLIDVDGPRPDERAVNGFLPLSDECALADCDRRYVAIARWTGAGDAPDRAFSLEASLVATGQGLGSVPIVDMSLSADGSLDADAIPAVSSASISGTFTRAGPVPQVHLHVPAAGLHDPLAYPFVGSITYCALDDRDPAGDAKSELAIGWGGDYPYDYAVTGCDWGMDWLSRCETGRDCDLTFRLAASWDVLPDGDSRTIHWRVAARLESLRSGASLPAIQLTVS